MEEFQKLICLRLYKSKTKMHNLKYSVDINYNSVVADFNNHVQKIIDSNIAANQNNVSAEIIEYNLTDNPKTIWIYRNFHNLKCNQDGHSVRSKISTVVAQNSIHTVELPINHCETCDEYYIGQNSLTAVQNKCGILLIKTQLCTPSQSYDVDFAHFRTESKLHSCGYNVIAGKLTATERKELLTYLLDNNIINKFEIRRDIAI